MANLHELHQGVSDKLMFWEKFALLVISKVKMNNEKIFAKKSCALKEKEELATCKQNLDIAITQVCNELLELNVPEDVASTTKV